MATPVFVGDTAMRVVSEIPMVNREGFDTLSVRFQGADSAIDSFLNSWPVGTRATGLTALGGSTNYSNMYLQTRSVTRGRSIGYVDTAFIGYIENTDANPISLSSRIGRMGVNLTTTQDENVAFEYNSEVTTARWLHYGNTAPRSPKYPISIPTDVPIAQLYNPNPANFTGQINAKLQGNLAQFDRERLAPGVWGIVETWELRILPVVTIQAAS